MAKNSHKPQSKLQLPLARARFKARLLGYTIGLLPIVGMLLLFRQTVPQWAALGLTAGGLYFFMLM
ncbi:hypothetical protein SAMN02745146_3445 [Hymenobacter daecheongensis DSM 21074]|uniref:Uncharacterized protein n=1 Tax=Hymenobacter daecheongensis DSM 21074 TaxID=1121955 RepID=A0A1M6KI70_9BACT|nr:hypothetical protein [Hymenobacter daecheongensis]SHJ58619.1 hypothetical protein SAMN02745146_3445 [Hymenobacter daecheongensis DSM 21074]